MEQSKLGTWRKCRRVGGQMTINLNSERNKKNTSHYYMDRATFNDGVFQIVLFEDCVEHRNCDDINLRRLINKLLGVSKSICVVDDMSKGLLNMSYTTKLKCNISVYMVEDIYNIFKQWRSELIERNQK